MESVNTEIFQSDYTQERYSLIFTSFVTWRSSAEKSPYNYRNRNIFNFHVQNQFISTGTQRDVTIIQLKEKKLLEKKQYSKQVNANKTRYTCAKNRNVYVARCTVRVFCHWNTLAQIHRHRNKQKMINKSTFFKDIFLHRLLSMREISIFFCISFWMHGKQSINAIHLL